MSLLIAMGISLIDAFCHLSTLKAWQTNKSKLLSEAMEQYTLKRKRSLAPEGEENLSNLTRGDYVGERNGTHIYRSASGANQPQEPEQTLQDEDNIIELKPAITMDDETPLVNKLPKPKEEAKGKSSNNTLGNLLLFFLLLGNLALIGIQTRLTNSLDKQNDKQSSALNSLKETIQTGFSEINDSLKEIKEEADKFMANEKLIPPAEQAIVEEAKKITPAKSSLNRAKPIKRIVKRHSKRNLKSANNIFQAPSYSSTENPTDLETTIDLAKNNKTNLVNSRMKADNEKKKIENEHSAFLDDDDEDDIIQAPARCWVNGHKGCSR